MKLNIYLWYTIYICSLTGEVCGGNRTFNISYVHFPPYFYQEMGGDSSNVDYIPRPIEGVDISMSSHRDFWFLISYFWFLISDFWFLGYAITTNFTFVPKVFWNVVVVRVWTFVKKKYSETSPNLHLIPWKPRISYIPSSVRHFSFHDWHIFLLFQIMLQKIPFAEYCTEYLNSSYSGWSFI